ncbi:MAG TPA: PQQ-binding-like beta-propeller repeat protein [Planctomycetota bacterium]|nr:PQQ-binding-like beta-propeller repeat protein [Planctomycetota bacterium]
MPGTRLALIPWTIVLTLVTSHAAAGPRWPQFRGPGATGSASDAIPDSWSVEENVAWKADIPGRAWSSPIVWDQQVFLTSAVSAGKEDDPKKGLYIGGNRLEPSENEHRWVVLSVAVDTGKVLWEAPVHRGKPRSSVHLKNTYASETPVTDGVRVYSYFGGVGLFAHDMDGKQLWATPFEPVKTRYGWGAAASPVLHGGRIIIVNDNEEKSYLAAFDAKSGNEVWRVDRDEKSNWATPFVWETPGRTEIVTNGSGKARSYSLEGKPLWELGGMSSITVCSPFASHGLLFLASGYIMDKARPLYAVRPGASGDITPEPGKTDGTFIAWSEPQAAPYNPSPLVAGDHIYVLFDRGYLSCREARTGKLVYDKRRISDEAVAFTASPWAAGGKVFCLSEEGDTFVIDGGPKFKVLKKNSLGEMCMATPAIAGDSLFVRTISKLYRIKSPAR